MKDYGITKKNEITDKADLHVESIKIKGYSIEDSFYDEKFCDYISDLLEKTYIRQLEEFGLDNLSKINELDIARMPFLYHHDFIDILMNPFILSICEKVLGNHFQLHLQNGIINRGNQEHHQSSWHRDLPYQDWIISKPLGFNAFVCLSDFTSQNGSTMFIPFTHKLDFFPSNNYAENNGVQLIAKKGSVIFFDSMLYHRATFNSTNNTRYGLNNMYVSPILKQQVNIPNAIKDISTLTDHQKSILGFNYQLSDDVNDYRLNRLKRVK